MAKPFSFDELLARVRALLRRRQPAAVQEPLHFADLLVDPNTHEVMRSNKRILLTAREFEMLMLFMQHPGNSSRAMSSTIVSGAMTLAATRTSSRSIFAICAPSWKTAASLASSTL